MTERKMTRTQRILKHLETVGSITPREALDLFGCMRLGARIWDLKREGYPIMKTMECRKKKRRAGDLRPLHLEGGGLMLWHRLDQELPPMRKPVLIWRGMSDSDGGFPMMGKHVLFEGKAYIRYKGADNMWCELNESEYKDTRWAEVERPEE